MRKRVETNVAGDGRQGCRRALHHLPGALQAQAQIEFPRAGIEVAAEQPFQVPEMNPRPLGDDAQLQRLLGMPAHRLQGTLQGAGAGDA